jgi:hypothetical protein
LRRSRQQRLFDNTVRAMVGAIFRGNALAMILATEIDDAKKAMSAN